VMCRRAVEMRVMFAALLEASAWLHRINVGGRVRHCDVSGEIGMECDLSKTVRAAAVAGWWTSLIGAAWVTAAWLVWLAIMSARPGWLLALWGVSDLGWEQVQTMMLWFIGVMKIILFVFILTSICLTIMARKLRKIALG
jgi:hypothetical protein